MENSKKLELTLCSMLPYKLQLHTIHVFRPNNKERPLIKGAKATLTGDLYADIENKTFGENPFKPILHSLNKLTEPILEGGLIPIVELRKLSGAFEPDDDFKNTFDVNYRNNKIIGFSALCMRVDQLQLFEKLKEWHFNIYDLPKDMYVEKSEVKI